jgi:hypothetical protein
MSIMRRRRFIALGAACAVWPVAALAQQSGSVQKFGVLWPGVSFPASPRMESFRLALRQLGYPLCCRSTHPNGTGMRWRCSASARSAGRSWGRRSACQVLAAQLISL